LTPDMDKKNGGRLRGPRFPVLSVYW
jgi:hypothetical protein